MRGVMSGAILLAMLAAGCSKGGEGKNPVTITVRDSAGIQIVEHPAQALEQAPRFGPGKVIATIGGPKADSLHDASTMLSGVFVGDGRFVVLESRSAQLILFDSTGKLTAKFGRRGSGPGEFKSPSVPRLSADGSIWLSDQSRLVRLTPELKPLGEHQIGSRIWGGLRFLLPLGDSAVLGSGQPLVSFSDPGQPMRRTRAFLVRVGTSKADTIASWPSEMQYPIQMDIGEGKVTYVQSVQFGRQTVLAPWHDGLVVGTGERWSLDVLDDKAALHRRIVLRETARPVTPAIRDSVLAAERRSLESSKSGGGDKSDLLAQLEKIRFADSIAPYERFIPARDGSLWVAEFAVPTDSLQHYAVFDAEGKLTRRVELPAKQRLLAVDGDMILVWRLGADDLGFLDLVRVVPLGN